jgi:hypothetical protein
MGPSVTELRTWLRWTLALSVVASALALLWPESRAPGPDGAMSNPIPLATGTPASGGAAVPARIAELPTELRQLALGAARFDPFVGVVPPAPTVPKPVPPPPVAAPAPMPVPPPIETPPPATRMPPPMNYRYLGRMVDPAGRVLIYLARDDTAVQVGVGSRLEGGYTVEAIDPAGVSLHYAPMDVRVVIPVPPPAQQAITR